jgi:adenylate cyclase
MANDPNKSGDWHPSRLIALRVRESYDPRENGGVSVAREQRRLAAIIAADVVGYSRLMGRDESGTLARLRENRAEHLNPVLSKYGGRLVKLTGDGALIEFASAVDALSASIEFQQAMAETNSDQPADNALEFRMGLHLGDLIVDGDDLYGDGVNIAARLEAEAPAGGVVISRTVHEAVTGRLKATFEDLGSLALKNIERPIQAFSVKWEPSDWLLPVTSEAPAAPATGPQAWLPLPDKPSIAVLPFQNMSGDPEQEYFVDGVVEDIITELTRHKSLFVIARNSSFTYKGKTIDIKQVGRELGVRYVLEGSVRKAGGRVRITGQLIDAISGAHVWAERFDREITDIFALQDEVTQSVVSAVEPSLRSAEIARKHSVPTQDLNAYDLCLRARADLGSDKKEDLQAAERLLRRAIELDPHYSDAWALLADAFALQNAAGWRVGPEAATELRQAALMATRVGPENGLAHAMASAYIAFYGAANDLDQAVDFANRAIALHPNSDEVCATVGWTFVCNGEFEKALGHLEAGLRMAPFGPRVARVLQGMSEAYFFQRKFDDAINYATRALPRMPKNLAAWRLKIAALAHANRLDEAREALQHLATLKPANSISTLPRRNYRHQWMRDLYSDGLRKAGVPE